MLGAIIGDIVGSVYDFHPVKTKNFPLFSAKSRFTDDTVMTLAVAEGLMNGGSAEDFVAAMRKYGVQYWRAGYGQRFFKWLCDDHPAPYNSYGNGSAMRVSPCAWFADNLERVLEFASRSASVTHNHPEGVKGALATAAAIFLARTGASKADIKAHVESEYGYDLSRSLEDIRPTYHFVEICQESVPEALIAFLESTDFEDAVRNAVSLGGDSDTQAAISGAVAEAFYGVPEALAERALEYLDAPLRAVVDAWRAGASTQKELLREARDDR